MRLISKELFDAGQFATSHSILEIVSPVYENHINVLSALFYLLLLFCLSALLCYFVLLALLLLPFLAIYSLVAKLDMLSESY